MHYLFFLNNPITWMFRHLTLDPATGYFRLLIWSSCRRLHCAFANHRRRNFKLGVLRNLERHRRFLLGLNRFCYIGLPMVVLLLLASLSACGLFGRKIKDRLINHDIRRIRTAFSLVLFLFAILGLAVHFWGSIWMLWSLCMGFFTSLEEYCLADLRGGHGFSASKSGASAKVRLPRGGVAACTA